MKTSVRRCSRGFTLIELLIGIAIILIIAALLAPVGCNTSPGSGEKVGQIVKVSKQGMVWKTWEAQLIRGGITDGSGAFGTVPFDFTIEDDATAQRVIKYMQDQTEVVIEYKMEGVYLPVRTESSGHFLVSIRPAKGGN
jgi:prepilin-type N-terminal cleavage/methylation domain-containing protein